MRHNPDKVVADLELLRDDALTDGVPTSAMWLTCAIETIRDLEAATADTGLRERVEALADEWETFPCGGTEALRQLRAALATPASTEDRADNEGTQQCFPAVDIEGHNCKLDSGHEPPHVCSCRKKWTD